MTGGIKLRLEKNKDKDVSQVEGKYLLWKIMYVYITDTRREMWEGNYISSVCGYTQTCERQ